MSAVEELRGKDSVTALAVRLNRQGRDKPVVVISVPAAASEPYIDAAHVADQLGDLAEVFLIRTGEDTFTFSDNMPARTEVYGGAGRVYPVGTEWVTNPYRSPLRFAFDAAQGEDAARALVADALRMASEAGLVSQPRHRSLPRRTGEVRGLPTPDRALVRLDGTFATILQELTLPDVPLDRVLATGMPVSGLYDEHSRRLDVRAELLSADQALRDYRVGDAVLAQVDTVASDSARLLLHPDVGVSVRRADVSSNELDDLTSLMTRGEVLTARVVATGPDWRLSLLDVDDDEVPRTAPALLRGGPPWLQAEDEVAVGSAVAAERDDIPTQVSLPPQPMPPQPAGPPASRQPDVTAAGPAPGAVPPDVPPHPTPALLDRRRREAPATEEPEPTQTPATALQTTSRALDATRAELAAAGEERDLLAAQVRALQGERGLAAKQIDALNRQIAHLQRQLEQSRAAHRKTTRRQARSGESGDTGVWFVDPEEQFRFEVQLAWARRIPAGEKADRPLPEYEIGPGFLPSVDAITGVSRDKIVDVVVELVTGLAFELAGREVHQLRTDEAGNAPQVVRSTDGAAGWRMALQRDTPQARRLHYWRLPDGTIELSRVALHDDYAP